jgi:REP element-mobilizing transposase RayT
MHVQWNTYGSWLPGDPRGFRNRNHRIHSSGTYKALPPPGEHAGLHMYAATRLARNPVELSQELRDRVLSAVIEKAHLLGWPLEAVAVARQHVHALIFVDDAIVDAEIGKLKRHSSHVIRGAIPGTVWSAGCHPEHVDDEEFWVNTVRYIMAHGEEGASVWRRPRDARLAAIGKR